MRPSTILALALLLPLLAAPTLGAPAADPRPIVPASEILAKIERGEPVEYDGVIVVGDLDLGGRILVPIFHLNDTVGYLDLGRMTLGTVHFNQTIFEGSVDFGDVNFTGDAWFLKANFNGNNVSFRGAKFSGDNSFREAEFSGDADFGYAVFSGGGASFEKTVFSGNADFGGAEFSDDADFWGVEFNGYASFRGAEFNGYASFRGTEFSDYADFWGAEFSDDAADFRSAVFSGESVDFDRAKFAHCDVNFAGAVFSDDVHFENSGFNHVNLTLEDTRDIRILWLSNATFVNESTISLKGTGYERLYVHWDRIKDGFVYNGEAYLTLVKNFKAIEYFEDADDCYYQYRRERQSMRSWGEWSKYTDILGWVTCGYGVRPGYTLLLGLAVVFVSAVYYWRRDAIRRLKGDEDESAKFSDAFYFSMMTFTTVGYGDWYPLDRHRKVVMIEGIIGWLTLSLFLVTLANVIIR